MNRPFTKHCRYQSAESACCIAEIRSIRAQAPRFFVWRGICLNDRCDQNEREMEFHKGTLFIGRMLEQPEQGFDKIDFVRPNTLTGVLFISGRNKGIEF